MEINHTSGNIRLIGISDSKSSSDIGPDQSISISSPGRLRRGKFWMISRNDDSPYLSMNHPNFTSS